MEGGPQMIVETNLSKVNPRPSPNGEYGEWYYYGPNKTKRLRYKLCDHCDYKTYNKILLIKHIEFHHPPTYPILLNFDQVHILKYHYESAIFY